MPLSEREQRLLDQLEQQLHAEDPRLVTHMSDVRRPQVSVRRIVLGSVIAVLGLAAVLLGVNLQNVFVGVAGAVLMGSGLFIVTTRGRGQSGAGAARGPAPRRAPGGRPQSSFMSSLEQRWDERRNQQH
ncbi:MAG: DUF3040 domain-containing protein [Micrococcus sp.]|nr:DUF3040 domain-containing protein [Micrococcus sp.]